MSRSIRSNLPALLPVLCGVIFAGITFAQNAPVLVIGSTTNPFATYYTQILKTEGLNASEYADLNSVTAATLSTRDVVILGETALTGPQVSMFTTWVNGGGNLIAMRPDKQLAGLLGLTDMGTTLAEGYIGINISQAPGLGITGQTMQFHGTSDRYALNGATSVAQLFSNATTALGTSPAVTWRSVGASGGKAAAFTYDLARSIVYTRQGNPAWAGTERDGITPIRSDDMFFGGTQPDWVDRSKIAIPQADEQQRLLVNLIEFLNISRKPLPRFWYFPFGKKAAVVMTGDNHALTGIPGRFDAFLAASAPGCVVANWECIRGTTYIYPNTPITAAQVQAYFNQGFEFGVHVNTNCANFTAATLPGFFTTQLQQFRTLFPFLPSPNSNRTHCIAFSDWSTQPKVELANGIRLDVTYYYWPANWVNNTPGYMTGSGMPQRFADLDGSVIDTYQSETQINDEANQVYPFTIDTLLDRALGPEGYYSFFTANIHTDSSTGQSQTWAMNIVNSAKARGVPVITARQFLTWTDARNDSVFGSLAWNGNTLTFTVTQSANANGMQVMLPRTAPSGSVAFITRGGANVPFTTQTIKGISYVVFTSATGNYTVSYSAPPSGVSVLPASANLGLNATQNLTATVTGLSNTSVTWTMSPAFGTLTPTGGSTATYTSPASAAGTTIVTITATSNGDTSLTATSTITVTPPGPSCPCTIWAPSALPAVLADPADGSAQELGVKFRASQAGYIKSIRFYKGTGNTGTHIGNLWTNAGVKLATATFTNETATGWQQVDFATPVAITANTTYVASYYAPAGHYAVNQNYFTASTVNGPLTALADGTDGGNGLFRYAVGGGFPNGTFKSSNYWVDVVFVTSIGNTPPVAVANSYTAVVNTPLTVAAPGVLSNDTDADGNPLTAIKVTNPTNGSVTLNSNGSFTYTPTAGFTGTDSFTYKANDGTADSNTVAVTITVNATPTAAGDSYSVNQGVTLTVASPGVLGNDTSPGGLTLTAIKLTDPANGTLTLNGNGSFTYVPNAGFFGTNTFTYKANNGTSDSNGATVTITVNPVPVAVGESYAVLAGQPITVSAPGVLGNDTSPGGLPLTAIKLSDPANGVVTLNGNGSFTYTPNAGFAGTNTFTYKANNGTTDSNVATVTLNVGAAPVAVTDLFNGASGQPLTIAAPGVLANDTSPGGITLIAIKVTDPANGTVTVLPAGGFTYTPNPGFVGTDSFTYKANNGTLDSNTVTVTLCACTIWPSSVVPAKTEETTDNNALEIGVKFRASQAGYIKSIRFYKGAGNTGTHIGNLWTAAGVKLATATFTNETATGWQQVNFATPVAIAANTTYVASYYAPVGHYAVNITYFATPTVNGPLTALDNAASGGNGVFNYTVGGGFPTGTFNSSNYWVDVVFVTSLGTQAPVAAANTYSAVPNTPLTVAAPGVLDNDTDPNNIPLTAIKVTNPTSGAVTLNSNGSFTYTPNAGYVGTDSFTYKANNGTTDSNIATVTINVNAAPVATADIYTGTSGQPLTVAAPGVLSNDTTATGVLTAIKVTNPANGTVTVLLTGGFTYTPNPGFVGTDSFTYKANNGTVDSNTVTVTLCACTIWPSSAVPAVLADPNDGSAQELGVKFRASQAGYIKSIRFYKGTTNTGTHIGNLWTAAGVKLATATFTNETTSGWQQVDFATPVAIAANTTYVASYYAPAGHYAVNTFYFTAPTVNGPLTALADGTDGGNGLFNYTVGGGFPAGTFKSSNYWVDVVFSTVP